MKLKLLIILGCLVFIFGFAVYQYFSIFDGKLHVVFCDVGQGDAVFIRTPNGRDVLIDAGVDDSVLSCLADNMPFWDKELDLVFATHPDADHISGFVPVLESYRVKQFNASKKTTETEVFERVTGLISEMNVPLRYLYSGDIYQLGGGIAITNLWPTKELIENSGENDSNRYSLVQILSFNEVEILLTGDIEEDQLNQILSAHPSLVKTIEVFKLPHHGSHTGISEVTFSLFKPKISIISAGKNNRYGHPHLEVLNTLERNNVKHLRTDQIGSIEFVSDGVGLQIAP